MDLNECKSITGYVVNLHAGEVTYSLRKQPMQALSSTEAEHMAAGAVTQGALWSWSLLSELDFRQVMPTVI